MKKFLFAFVAVAALTTGAQAADLGSPRTPIAAAVVSPAFNWTGFYLGAHVGYGFGKTTACDGPCQGINGGGPFVGAQLGYNYQINSLVVGAEADLAFAAISGRETNSFGFAGFNTYLRTSMLGSARLRGGVAVDRALFYVTGGLGMARNQYGAFFGGGGLNNYTRLGWTLGAGVEYALTQNWTVKGEYLYYQFSARNMVAPLNATATVRNDVHTFKIGVNYLFSTGPSAVVARY